jgi:hypothetical protein
MSNFGVVRLDNMTGTIDGSQLFSGKYHNGTAYAAIDNGNIVKFDSLLDAETWKVVTPSANTAIGSLGLVASEEHFYDNGYKNLVEFQNEAGAIIRIYAFNSHNTFSVTADDFTAAATVAEGDIVEAAAATKMKIVAKATGLTSGSTQIGTVVKIETVGTLTYYVIQVV